MTTQFIRKLRSLNILCLKKQQKCDVFDPQFFWGSHLAMLRGMVWYGIVEFNVPFDTV